MPDTQAREPTGFSAYNLLRAFIQTVGIFLLVQFVMRQFTGSGTPSTSTNTTASMPGAGLPIPAYSARSSQDGLDGPLNPVPQTIVPMWPTGTPLDISMYLSSSFAMPALKSMPRESLVLQEKRMVLGNWSDTRDIYTKVVLPKQVQENGTLWAHIYVAQSGSLLDPLEKHYDPSRAFNFVKPLNQYLPKKKIARRRNLLGGNVDGVTDAEQDMQSPGTVVASYYHPNFTISLIPDSDVQSYVQMHPAVREWIQLDPTGARDVSGQNGWYYPIIFLNRFWQLRTHMIELNSTVTELPLNIHLNNLANWKFSILSSMDFGMKQASEKAAQGQSITGGDGSEFEEIKRILLDSNSYLLGTTVVVGILHTIFEMLAFKNDVSHWRNKKDNVGVSVRTILANVFMQTIIFLYLVDNTENTSWMILFGQGMGILLEAWKITKTVDVRVRPTPADSVAFPWRYLPYTVVFEDKHKLSETEKQTEEYDRIAFKYMYYLAIPLLAAYAVYSLMYESHKSWYSFIITTLVGSVYAYGFLMMVPSLYINYRLKSVAHMPAKAMTYKFLNTFIDDLFAFTIKMPMLHRLATLRDDFIFFVYLYQSWKYKVDYSRVNEFGQGGDEEVDSTLATKPLEPSSSDAANDQVVVPMTAKEVKSETTGIERTAAAVKRRK